MNIKTLLCTVSVLAPVIPQGICGEGGGFTKCGLDGNYYANTTLTAPAVFSRRDVRLNFWWNNPTGNPLNVSGTKSYPMASTNFSVVWTGQIVAKYSEVYTFTTTSDEGMNLWIKPTTTGTWTKVIDHWTAHAWADKTGTWTFTSGVLYDIKVEYWQGSGDAVCKLFWESPSTVKEYVEPATPIGINTGFTSDWGTDYIFADAVRQGRSFGSSSQPSDGSCTLGADGWPAQADFGQIIITGSNPNGIVPYGTYKLSFNGQAATQNGVYAQFGWASVQNRIYIGATNTTTADVIVSADHGSLNLIFQGTNRNPAGGGGPGLTNIKLMRPGESSTAQIAASYKTLVKNFAAIRGMNYFDINGNTLTSWSGRTRPSVVNQTTAPNGGSIEYMIMLCNETGKDLWLNLPANVPEDFFTKAAQACRFGTDGTNPYTSAQSAPVYPPLNPNLKVYVEWSNELWNFAGGFTQYHDNRAAALAAVLADTPEGLRLNYDNLSETPDANGNYPNINAWGVRRWIDQTIRASICFRTVYTDAVFTDRVRVIFQDKYGEDFGALNFANIFYNNADGGTHSSPGRPLSYYLWAAGGAWYGHPTDQNATTVDGLYASIQSIGPMFLGAEATAARAYGLRVVGYEGGFACGGDTCSDIQYAGNLDARAQAAVVSQATEWFNYSGDLAMVYQATGGYNSAYGLATPTVEDQNRPKLLGHIQMTNALKPPALLGHILPTNSIPLPNGWLNNNSAPVEVAFRVATPGTYTMAISFGTNTSPIIQVDGVTVGSPVYTTTGGTFSTPVTLTRGVHGIWIRNATPGNGWMGSININSGGTNILPEADTYVWDGAPTTIYGTGTALGIKGGAAGYTRISYLRFPVTQTGASYKLYLKTELIGGEGPGNRTIEVRQLTDDSWSETTMNWNNRAASTGTLIATITDAGTVGNVYSVDVTSYANAQVADGKASFVLTQPAASPRYVELGSREDLVNKPLLIRQ